MYYQYTPERVSTCPLTVHALLHIADSIETAGPVWAYWAFPMERYCGHLQRAIQSRRFPYVNINRYLVDTARLNHITIWYHLNDCLNMKSQKMPLDHVQTFAECMFSLTNPDCSLTFLK